MSTTTDLTIEYVERRAKFKKRAESNLNRTLHNFKQLERCSNRGARCRSSPGPVRASLRASWRMPEDPDRRASLTVLNEIAFLDE